jgi:phage terminase small subunit
MARTATKKQKGFAKDYVETGNGSLAALKNYNIKAENKRNVAGAIASENLTKPKVQELIEGYAKRATENIQTLAENAENETVRLNANKDQLDRAGYKPIERSMNLQLNVSPQDPKAKALAEEYEKKLKEQIEPLEP